MVSPAEAPSVTAHVQNTTRLVMCGASVGTNGFGAMVPYMGQLLAMRYATRRSIQTI